MSRLEILGPEGLRIGLSIFQASADEKDGRRWNELRRFQFRIGLRAEADGSSYLEHGNSKVICVVNGPHEPVSRSNNTKANINVELTVASFSETDRKKRNRTDRRIQEYSKVIEKAFDVAVLTNLIPRSQIDIKLHVLSQDGGLLQDVINAATLALVDAGVPMVNYVCACTAGCLQDDVLLDLNSIEEHDLSWCTVVTLGKSGRVTLLQMENKVQLERFESIMAAAISGCEQINAIMEDMVRRTSKEFLEKIKVW